MAKASLESQLIAGAGQAVSKDPYGMVMQAQERASQKVIEGVKGVASTLGKIHQGRLAEEEKLQTERDDLVKGYDDNFNSHLKSYLDDGGLPMEVWDRATDLAEEEKVVHDACPIGKEGNRCRKKSIMRLKEQATQWTDANDWYSDLAETHEKYQGEDPELVQSNYDSESDDGVRRKRIKANMDPKQLVMRNKNDNEIASVKKQLKDMDFMQDSVSMQEKEALRKQLEQLEKSNTKVTGWDIPGEGFMTKEEIKNLKLFQPRADIIKKHVMDRNKSQTETNYAPYKDGTGGEPFNMRTSISANEEAITPGNITSIYYDKVTGTDNPLKENLKEHPMLKGVDGKGATYKSLGISGEDLKDLDTDPDGIISDDEMANLIKALSDPKHPNYDYDVSKAVAAEYMAENEQMEYNKFMYGPNFYEKPDGTRTTLEERRATKIKAATPEPGESQQVFKDRGGNLSLAKELGITWNNETKTWNKPQFETDKAYQDWLKSLDKK